MERILYIFIMDFILKVKFSIYYGFLLYVIIYYGSYIWG